MTLGRHVGYKFHAPYLNISCRHASSLVWEKWMNRTERKWRIELILRFVRDIWDVDGGSVLFEKIEIGWSSNFGKDWRLD